MTWPVAQVGLFHQTTPLFLYVLQISHGSRHSTSRVLVTVYMRGHLYPKRPWPWSQRILAVGSLRLWPLHLLSGGMQGGQSAACRWTPKSKIRVPGSPAASLHPFLREKAVLRDLRLLRHACSAGSLWEEPTGSIQLNATLLSTHNVRASRRAREMGTTPNSRSRKPPKYAIR